MLCGVQEISLSDRSLQGGGGVAVGAPPLTATLNQCFENFVIIFLFIFLIFFLNKMKIRMSNNALYSDSPATTRHYYSFFFSFYLKKNPDWGFKKTAKFRGIDFSLANIDL